MYHIWMTVYEKAYWENWRTNSNKISLDKSYDFRRMHERRERSLIFRAHGALEIETKHIS